MQTTTIQSAGPMRAPKDTCVAYLFWLISCHHFYLGNICVGILYILTMGGFGLWALIDLCLMPSHVQAANIRNGCYAQGGSVTTVVQSPPQYAQQPMQMQPQVWM
ncbi:hypothetical protein KIPB_002062 [Kipferlia bialata]|uniref:TM2 domain-containing protein n=1 Tax=Kipferlia bialata TaxID=797122 RepID=A0A391NUA2_9EUKA|nr:hypothetical protein KIPB_002062 [Kipferlia bialata]|eukprot:g2062.t1